MVAPAESRPCPATAVATNGTFGISLAQDGTVWAWGSNSDGQLGVASGDAVPHAVHVAGPTDVVAIAAGSAFGLALQRDGSVWAWGRNDFGQLGDGTTDPRVGAAPVPGMVDIVEIAARDATALALESDGTVWAWGSNIAFVAGIDGGTTIAAPTVVAGLPVDVESIAVGSYAVTSTGQVYEWGMSAAYEAPALVAGISCAERISAQGHVLALCADGSVWAWGDNSAGQLGDGTLNFGFAPAMVAGIGPAVSIAAGLAHSVVVEADGSVVTFGGNARGELGLGMRDASMLPTAIPGIADGLAVAAGGTPTSRKTMLLRGDGTIWTWGDGAVGQLGHGGNDPGVVAGIPSVVSIAGASVSSRVVTLDGRAWEWGGRWTDNVRDPLPIAGVTDGVVVEAGDFHAVVSTAAGPAKAWGRNASGQLGDSSTTDANSTATDVSTLLDVVSVTGGEASSGAILADGTLWTWGSNRDGELGIGSTSPSTVPVEVTALTAVAEVDMGEGNGQTHAVARLDDGTVYGWGQNGMGQVGDGSTSLRTSPVELTGIGGAAVSVAAGQQHSVIARDDGAVLAWGANSDGQLGMGFVDPSWPRPRVVPGIDRVEAVAAGRFFTLALRDDGTVWGWGSNSAGQLADGTLTARGAPQRIGGLERIVEIAAGGTHGLALRDDGVVFGWGDSVRWQTGVPLHDPTVPRKIAGCSACTSFPPEVSPPGDPVPLTVRRDRAAGTYVVEFGAIGATIYRVHRGVIGAWYSHGARGGSSNCDTAGGVPAHSEPVGSTPGASVYWLASAVEGACEGTLGWAMHRGVPTTERPEAEPACP